MGRDATDGPRWAARGRPRGGAANAVIATGHAMLGITLAPATGQLVADILEGRELPRFAAAFSPDRFGALALR